MITIFCDFRQFTAKKLAFFSKTNVLIKVLQKLAAVCAKNARLFANFFGENIIKIGPRMSGFFSWFFPGIDITLKF
jgi:hypothetical protein